MVMQSRSGGPVTFEADIKPLFRTKDRESMQRAFDLWSYADVKAHADAIVSHLRAGDMPCDGAWPGPQVDLFQQWVDSGKAE